MANLVTLSKELSQLLHLDFPPIAISFSNHAPEGVPTYWGQAPAGCRFWQDAAAGAFTTTAADHELCAIGVYTHNLESSPSQQKDLMDALKVFADLGYVRAEDMPQISVLKQRFKYVTYAPLGEAPLRPDLALLFVRADQTLILSEAAQQIEGDHAPAMGRPACALVSEVINSGRAAMSLGCCGARAYLDAFTDEKAIFAIPGAKLEAYVERIDELSRANELLSRFHQLRRDAIAAGSRPTIQESLAEFMGAQS